MKLKTFFLHWTAEVRGIQAVEAFDEEDAESQFSSFKTVDEMDDEPLNAELTDIVVEKKKRKSNVRR